MRVLQVAERLKATGFETVVVMPKGDQKFAALLDQACIPFHEMNLVRLRKSVSPIEHVRYAARFWPNVIELRRLIRERRIDIVHTNGMMNLQTPIAAHLEGVGLIWHLNDLGTPLLLRLIFLPLLKSWTDGIALSSRAVGRYYFRRRARVDQRFHLAYPPVDVEKFSPRLNGSNAREQFGLDPNCPVIGVVANICPGKGQEYLIEAAEIIKRRYRGAKVLVVGGKLDNRHKFWSALMKQTAELGLERDVVFTGRRDDVPELLRAMTVYVHPSESESCGMAILEASACGLPVVATDVGGPRELVEDGVTGILVEPRNPAQIAEAVLRLLDSPEMARRMGQAGAARMRKHFSLDACVDAHMRMYNAVLSRAGTPVPTGRVPPPPAATEEVEDVYSRN